ncbi:SAM-dependent methlyltransferase [Vibrio galatheae]|uniref:tRNA1(Val) (adenine(37)-N6)-methyltransferase n=1 Tax=Vibrio galatheae TaxID=579748 RepID=A0A0F4NKE9_9VIBR|nr:methyltransferase [Vibrio galatheae]KJY83685.1 SAM-dependent methlyltransferase [Vibrio galatheae]
MKKTKDFHFKQFSIDGGYTGMPVSTDGVLLGAWIDLENAQSLLDIGTGTGLLSLMCAQRSPRLSIQAIDIDQHATMAAKNNFSRSQWRAKLTLHHGDILNYDFTDQFECIICNPPYFNSGEQADNASRALARHTHSLGHQALLRRCQQLLSYDGKASFVLPKVEGEQFIQAAEHQGWSLSRLCHVKSTPNKEVSRLLIELTKLSQPIKLETLTIHANGGYSNDFTALTKVFYLKM